MVTTKRKAYLIAHRGWSSRFPENSMPAFAAAIAAGADEIEFDVRTSSDGVPIVCHDKTTDRVSDLSGEVKSFTEIELRNAAIRFGDELLPGLGFPTLHDVLAKFINHVTMNIHIKALDSAKTALHLLASVDLTSARSIYIAGDVEVLQGALEICPHIPRCLIQGRKDTNMERVFENASALGCRRIQFFKGYYETADLQEALARGFITNLYWADEPVEAEAAVQNGVIGLLTNDIGPIRQYLAQKDMLIVNDCEL